MARQKPMQTWTFIDFLSRRGLPFPRHHNSSNGVNYQKHLQFWGKVTLNKI